MRMIVFWVALLLITGGCRENDRTTEIVSVAHDILMAASQKDLVALDSLTVDTIAYRRLRLLAQKESDLVVAGIQRLEPIDVWHRGDTTGMNFAVTTDRGRDIIQMTFVRVNGRWRLRYVTLPERG